MVTDTGCLYACGLPTPLAVLTRAVLFRFLLSFLQIRCDTATGMCSSGSLRGVQRCLADPSLDYRVRIEWQGLEAPCRRTKCPETVGGIHYMSHFTLGDPLAGATGLEKIRACLANLGAKTWEQIIGMAPNDTYVAARAVLDAVNSSWGQWDSQWVGGRPTD